MRGDRDLPVAVHLAAPLAAEVVAYVEGEVGWQVVGLDGPPRPALVLAAAAVPGRVTVVVVEGRPDADDVRAAFEAGAVDVVSWPAERARLVAAPARASARPATVGGPPLLRVAGAAGGVGTSTVTLALAGLLAWAGRDVLVLGDEGLLLLAGIGGWRGPGAPEIAGLDARDAGAEVEVLAKPVPGVRGLRALGGGAAALEPATTPSLSGWPVDLVVADLGSRPDAGCEVRCARPDAHLARIAGRGDPVLLVGEGPLSPRAARRVLGRDPLAWLPASARVARAGARGRVPADLPGTWLETLRTALRAVRLTTAPTSRP